MPAVKMEIKASVQCRNAELRSIRIRKNNMVHDITWGFYDFYIEHGVACWTLKHIRLDDSIIKAKKLADMRAKASRENRLYIIAANLDNSETIQEILLTDIAITTREAHTLSINLQDGYKATPGFPEPEPGTEIMLITPEHQIIRCVLNRDMSEQSALNLFHQILQEQNIKPPVTVSDILEVSPEVLAKYGIRFENTGCTRYLNFGKSRLLPHAVP